MVLFNKDGLFASQREISTDPISIADGATVTLDGVNINGDGNWDSGDYAGITCLGDATIILKDGSTNTVKGFYEDYPGILVPEGKMLTIKGETEGNGSLTASSDGFTTPESSEPEPEAPAVTPTENKNEWTFTMPDYAIVARVEYDTELALNEVEDNAAHAEGCVRSGWQEGRDTLKRWLSKDLKDSKDYSLL